MRMFKLIGALIAVLAFSMLGVSSASAAEVLWPLLPGSVGETFSGTLDEGAGNPKLQEEKEKIKAGASIICKTFTIGAGKGVLLEEGSTNKKDATLALVTEGTFTGCEALGSAANSKGDAAGTILVHLELHTCLIEWLGKKEQDGILILPLETVIEVLKKAAITILDAKGTGFVAPIKKIGVSQYLIDAKQKEGLQEVKKCEGNTEEESLKTLLAGATKEELAAEEAQVLIKFAKTIDAEEVLS